MGYYFYARPLCRETRQRNSLQIVEIPPINPIIVEHRLHQLMCQECGTLTRATLSVDVHIAVCVRMKYSISRTMSYRA